MFLRVTFPPCYPDVVPVLEIPDRFGVLSKVQHREMLAHLLETVSSFVDIDDRDFNI